MLSYRHAFHAGNHADMLKHFCLFEVMRYFNRKEKPYCYTDTHAGAGVYALTGAEAQKVGEYRDGIAKLQAADILPEALNDFLRQTAAALHDADTYCGSPFLAASMMRAADRAELFELHPADSVLLAENMKSTRYNKRIHVHPADGFAGLNAVLPPKERRGIILIDPPYEQKSDYETVEKVLKRALEKFASGCYLVWYPVLSRYESARLPASLENLLPDNFLQAELHVRRPQADGFGMHGSGMFVLNPPYTLPAVLAEVLPALAGLLAQDNGARFVLNSRIA